MSTARDSIFADIRRALGPAPAPADDIAADLAAILADPAAVQPVFDPDRLEDRFIEKATSEKVTATLTRVATLADIPAAVAAYLDEVKLPRRIALQPAERLTGLDWAGIETHHAPSTEEPVSLTMADFAIAETGSMVFRSREDAPVLFNFLPLHHLVAVAAETILPRMEDYWRGVAERGEAQPRATNIITGTSGTADIEAKNVRGAHGPRHMRILLIGGK